MPASGESRSCNSHDRVASVEKWGRQQSDGYCRANGRTERRIDSSSGNDLLARCEYEEVDNDGVIALVW